MAKIKVQPQNALNLYVATGLIMPLLHAIPPDVKSWILGIRNKLEQAQSEEKSVYDFQQLRINSLKKLIEHINQADQDKIIVIQQYLEEFLSGNVMHVADVKSEVKILYTHENVATILKMLEKKMGRTTQKFKQSVTEVLEEIKHEPINEVETRS